MVTRLVETWRPLNPTFQFHLDPHVGVLTRICCVHASFHKKFRRALNGPDPDQNSVWLRSLYNVVCKMIGDERISDDEKQEALLRVDIPRRMSSAGQLDGQLDVEEEQIEAEAKQLKNLLSIYEQLSSMM
jgi:hypothetical protein